MAIIISSACLIQLCALANGHHHIISMSNSNQHVEPAFAECIYMWHACSEWKENSPELLLKRRRRKRKKRISTQQETGIYLAYGETSGVCLLSSWHQLVGKLNLTTPVCSSWHAHHCSSIWAFPSISVRVQVVGIRDWHFNAR